MTRSRLYIEDYLTIFYQKDVSSKHLNLDRFIPFIIYSLLSLERYPRDTNATKLPLLSMIGAPLVPSKSVLSYNSSGSNNENNDNHHLNQ